MARQVKEHWWQYRRACRQYEYDCLMPCHALLAVLKRGSDVCVIKGWRLAGSSLMLVNGMPSDLANFDIYSFIDLIKQEVKPFIC